MTCRKRISERSQAVDERPVLSTSAIIASSSLVCFTCTHRAMKQKRRAKTMKKILQMKRATELEKLQDNIKARVKNIYASLKLV
jgi:hypothetical protein